MTSLKVPMTQAVRALRAASVRFVPHLYPYVERGGTGASARALGTSEHRIIKTLVMQNEREDALIVLMHGNDEVSTKTLARYLGVKSVAPCSREKANRLSGYRVGGISPFGFRCVLPVYIEASILKIPVMLVNGGKRGFLLEIKPTDLSVLLDYQVVSVGVRQKP